MKNKIIGILIIILVIAVIRIYPNFNKQSDIIGQTQQECSLFIQNHIAQLSPTDPVLWGTRYTTDIQYTTWSTTAIVNYEDGHIAETISIECSLENNEVKIGTITRLSTQ